MSITDLDQLTEIQLTLQEDGTFSNGLWTLAEVLGYFNQRQYRFLFETKILAASGLIVWNPGQEQMPLPDDWIVTISASWQRFDTGEWSPLPRSDRFERDHLLGPLAATATSTALPQAFREGDVTETLSIAVSPAPSQPGQVGLLYVSLSEILDGQGQIFDVPDDWVPYLKYGVYSDMLGKTGRGQDLLRARYAEQRFQEGVVLAQSLLQGWP